MNKVQKIIWTLYLPLIIIGFIRSSETGYDKYHLL